MSREHPVLVHLVAKILLSLMDGTQFDLMIVTLLDGQYSTPDMNVNYSTAGLFVPLERRTFLPG